MFRIPTYQIKTIRKQANVIDVATPYRTGFNYLDWPVIRPTANE